MSQIEEIPGLVRRLYAIVAELEQLFPRRKFTPDGHLVGSLGEVLAAHHYGIEMLQSSANVHDARTRSGRLVQIKATQRTSVGLRAQPQHLLVLRIGEDGTLQEVFNGPGSLAWRNAGPRQSNGQRQISLSRLRELMKSVPETARLRRGDA